MTPGQRARSPLPSQVSSGWRVGEPCSSGREPGRILVATNGRLLNRINDRHGLGIPGPESPLGADEADRIEVGEIGEHGLPLFPHARHQLHKLSQESAGHVISVDVAGDDHCLKQLGWCGPRLRLQGVDYRSGKRILRLSGRQQAGQKESGDKGCHGRQAAHQRQPTAEATASEVA
jgi:hypothetical protein